MHHNNAFKENESGICAIDLFQEKRDMTKYNNYIHNVQIKEVLRNRRELNVFYLSHGRGFSKPD